MFPGVKRPLGAKGAQQITTCTVNLLCCTKTENKTKQKGGEGIYSTSIHCLTSHRTHTSLNQENTAQFKNPDVKEGVDLCPLNYKRSAYSYSTLRWENCRQSVLVFTLLFARLPQRSTPHLVVREKTAQQGQQRGKLLDLLSHFIYLLTGLSRHILCH